MTVVEIALLFGTGAFAGLLGGLFGIGGGVVVVPVLYAVYTTMEVPESERIKLAVGTSLATIIVTSLRSLAGHARSNQVDWALLRFWGPFIAGGSLLGAWLARIVPADALTLLFAVGILGIAVQRGVAGRARREAEGRLPGRPLQGTLAFATGLASAMMGIGGGVFGVLLLTRFGRSVHAAVATAAGFGLAIAVPGAIGFAASGRADGLPPFALGYVDLAAFAAVAAGSAVTAPLGARVAHRLPAATLTRSFALYLAITGVLLLREAL